MPSFAPRFLTLMLCGAALCGCSMLSPSSDLKDTLGVKDKPAPQATASAQNDIDGNVRQARLLRLAGQYDQAITVLSQLMLVASDNPQVVAEYGKTLAQKGRAQDAAQFLRRAIELSPNDWTLYSALGVSYDQTGDQVNARAAYEHALALKPGEASVLNNYALSRMLAKDPEGAQVLIARAKANGAPDDKQIADNVALIASLVPKPEEAKPVAVAAGTPKVAAAKPAPAKAAQAIATNVPLPLPVAAPAPAPSTGAPRALVPAARPQQAMALPPQVAAARAAPLPEYPATVVMQAVPVDPYAGPVKLHMPKPKAVASAAKPAPAKNAPGAKPDAKAQAQAKPAHAPADPKAQAAKTEPAVPAKTASAKKDTIPALRMAADKY